ncbi:hypothetical protein G3N57_25275 [Paraburkholderia sp. Se-20369]|nr:hypothetical protein [Paraburkholderia sp. Se-20369]TCW82093.1 hypothetical protein C5O80_20555 [Burkholderia sp. SRS-46]
MNDLLQKVLDAYGGLDRWNTFSKLDVKSETGGPFWFTHGILESHACSNVTIKAHEEWTSIYPYDAPDHRMIFVPDRVVIENNDHQVIAQLDHPRAAFDGYGEYSYWDVVHQAYFNGYALWTYLAAPFSLALPGVKVKEVAPWHEDGEVWRVLNVVFPPTIASHSAEQNFYFGPDYLLRRQDYHIDVSVDTPVAHYVSDFVEVQGIKFPTRRHAYLRTADDLPDRNALLVWIRFNDFRLS